MNLYTVTKEFSAPQLGDRLHVGDVVGKMGTRVACLIDGMERYSESFYEWVGTVDSLNYLFLTGTLPDPGIPGVANVKAGSAAITSGSSEVIVSGAAWGFVPTGFAVIVTKPDGGDNLFATVRDSTITADGFTADLSAPASSAGYVLVYVVVE